MKLLCHGIAASFVRYVGVGLLSVLVDFLALFLLHSGAGLVLWASTVIAYATSLVVNYLLNRIWTFAAGDGSADYFGAVPRFAVLIAINLGLTLLIVLWLNHLGVDYLVAKLAGATVVGAIDFPAYRWWVFR